MKGFKNPNISFKFERDRIMKKMVSIPTSPRKENETMKQAGFIIDRENEVYVMEELGAFMSNITDDIQEIDELREYEDKLHNNPYREIVRLMDEEGYELVLGPGAPLGIGSLPKKGLYCKNYREIVEKQKRDKQEQAKQEDAR